MAKWIVNGDLDKYMSRLQKLGKETEQKVVGKALYDAGAIVADQIKQNIGMIPQDDRYIPKGSTTRGIPGKAIEGLKDSLGITKMLQDRHYVYNIKVGFDGYNGNVTKRWPQGAPNQLVARAVEKGTSWLIATPFNKKALAVATKPAQEAMQKAVEDGIKNIMEE